MKHFSVLYYDVHRISSSLVHFLSEQIILLSPVSLKQHLSTVLFLFFSFQSAAHISLWLWWQRKQHKHKLIDRGRCSRHARIFNSPFEEDIINRGAMGWAVTSDNSKQVSTLQSCSHFNTSLLCSVPDTQVQVDCLVCRCIVRVLSLETETDHSTYGPAALWVDITNRKRFHHGVRTLYRSVS